MEKIIRALGGRKFMLAVVALGVSTAVEIVTERGMTENMTTMILGIVGAFSLTNALTTHSFESSKAKKAQASKGPDTQGLAPISEKLDLLIAYVESSQNDGSAQEVRDSILNTNATVNQLGELMANQNKLLQAIVSKSSTRGN